MKPFILTLLILLFSQGVFAQTFTLDNKGIIKCPTAQVGAKGTVNGVEYEAVDRNLLIQRRDQSADLTKVCTSLVTDLSFMFYGKSFNQAIGNWDVSNVTDMWAMFDASSFNQPIGNWDVGKVTNMRGMFLSATFFNQPLGEWNVSNVERMDNLFDKSAFNQPIGSWNVSKVKTMYEMFKGTPFNQAIGNWDVRSVNDMRGMFSSATAFNQPINNWCVTNIATEPTSFSVGSPLTAQNKPVWGSCPTNSVSPTVTTLTITNIGTTTSTAGGNVTSQGSSAVTSRGVCYATTQNPTTSNQCVASGSGTGSFTANLSGLASGTLYYVRAYATNLAGTAYGSQVSFSTNQVNVLPTLTTFAATEIGTISARVGGNVIDAGSSNIVDRGVCYSTSPNPTEWTGCAGSGNGLGSFTVVIENLTPGTTYYFRAYAINSSGFSYGQMLSFSTQILSTPPTVTTTSITNIGNTTAATGGTVTSAGSSTVTSRGVCYATTQNPTISNQCVNSGSGVGNYITNLTGLSQGTLYYVRSYATNSAGTSYGNQVSFSTTASPSNLAYLQIIHNAPGGFVDVLLNGVTILNDFQYQSATPYVEIAAETPFNIDIKTANGVTTLISINAAVLNSNQSYIFILTGGNNGKPFEMKVVGNARRSSSEPNSMQYFFNHGVTNGPIFDVERLTTSLPYAIEEQIALNAGYGSITSYRNLPNPGLSIFQLSVSGFVVSRYLYDFGNYSGQTMVLVATGAIGGSGANALTIMGVDAAGNVIRPQNITGEEGPTVTTSVVTSIGTMTATTGGNVTNAGSATVTNRGVCYSNMQNPTTSDQCVASGSGIGNFSVNLNNLSSGSLYYVRAYATNSVGTSYGNQVSFTTLDVPNVPPTVSTDIITSIGTTTATAGGVVTDSGSSEVTARGVCFATTSNPMTTDQCISSGNGTGSFTVNLTGLSSGTLYYLRAYAVNSVGTSYGNEVNFTTQSSQSVAPTVTTETVSNIGTNAATSGGTVTDAGSTEVSARGVCYATTQNPTTSNSCFPSGSGTGVFTSNLTGLNSGTLYYIRAYATNLAGTSYGNQLSFTTSTELVTPTVVTSVITDIGLTTALAGGNVTNSGSSAILMRGVCYSTIQNPTTANNCVTVGGNVGSYTTPISGLSTFTTYYLRAFATNSAGTSYGNQVSFATQNPFVNKPPTINQISNVTIQHTIPTPLSIPISGISAGFGETGQNISITASSSDSLLIPILQVDYTTPQPIGILRIKNDRNRVGSATIRIKVKDDAGTANGGIDTLVVNFVVNVLLDTDLGKDETNPLGFHLAQNFPNPFNPTTQISFTLPSSATVRLEVFNSLGQPVSVIAEGQLPAGAHTYAFDGAALSSGVYLYRLTTPDFVQTRVMALVK
jgi:surface protein